MQRRFQSLVAIGNDASGLKSIGVVVGMLEPGALWPAVKDSPGLWRSRNCW